MVRLTDAERRALNELVSDAYNDFKEIASRYLDEDEIESLEKKLAKG